jgi:hypothetical protein
MRTSARKRSGCRAQSGGDTGCASTPIEAGSGEARQFESIGEVNEVLANGGLFGHAESAWA